MTRLDPFDYPFVEDLDQIERELQAGHEATAQFSGPIREWLTISGADADIDHDKWPIIPAAPYVERLNAMCGKWGEQLCVRFYAHYSEVFDGKSLMHFPNVCNLAIDSLDEAINLDVIAELTHVTQLLVGFYDMDDKALLSKLPLHQYTHLVLPATKTKALDLAPIAGAHRLKRLYLDGHHKNIQALGELSNLEEFTFNAKKGLDLGFINGMENLRALKFLLGGTESIEGIALGSLEELAFTQVRELAELGDMQRFPALKRMLMQDQQHVERVQFGAANRALEHLWFYNCGKLTEIAGLAECSALKSLRWIFTDVDPACLQLPGSLTHLHMLSGKRGAEAKEKAAIEAMGYVADDHEDSWFFFK